MSIGNYDWLEARYEEFRVALEGGDTDLAKSIVENIYLAGYEAHAKKIAEELEESAKRTVEVDEKEKNDEMFIDEHPLS